VKLFLWKATGGYLPNRTRLQTKGVDYSVYYPYCYGTYENEFHAVFGCDKTHEDRLAFGTDYENMLVNQMSLWNFAFRFCIPS